MIIHRTISRFIGLNDIIATERVIKRELYAIGQGLADGIDIPCDAETPRMKLLRKHKDGPLIGAAESSWRARAAFDARPIQFQGRRLLYFCGQPTYRTDRQLFVGVAEWVAGELNIAAEPVIVPDCESRGIDIPAFTVIGDRIVGVYLDDYGPRRTGKGTDADLVVVDSKNGSSFRKRIIRRPFAGNPFDRIGLPWILADGGSARIYLRCKRRRENILVACDLDLASLTVTPPEKLCRFPRNPINIAVTKRRGQYLVFYGATVGGGLYVARSHDGRDFDFSNEIMLVSDEPKWGWDFYKVCGSPDNSEERIVDLCYTSSNRGVLMIGAAQFDSSTLPA